MLPSAKKFLEITNNTSPDIAVILGSGLTNFFEEKDIQESKNLVSKFPDIVKKLSELGNKFNQNLKKTKRQPGKI